MDAPVGRLGRHDIKMGVQQQLSSGGVATWQGCEDVAPAGLAGFDILGPVAHVLELLLHPAGTFFLALGGLELTGVAGVEADQPADQADNFIGCGGSVGVGAHLLIPIILTTFGPGAQRSRRFQRQVRWSKSPRTQPMWR